MHVLPIEQEVTRKLVKVSESTGKRFFLITHHPTDHCQQQVIFLVSQSAEYRFNIPGGMIGALHTLGFVEGEDGPSATLAEKAFAAVAANFETPPGPAAVSSNVTNNHLRLDGGNSGTIALGQNVQVLVNNVRLDESLAELRKLAAGNADLLEQVDNIADEAKSGKAEPRKLRAYLSTALTHAKGNASIVSATVAVANLLGLGVWIKQHLGL